jgi:hypothetical protein
MVPSGELYDERTERFITVNGRELQLEHSLVSISKWESKWKKPFLSGEAKSREETIDYIRCMTISQNVDPNVFLGLSEANIDAVNRYIDDPMTATTFKNSQKKPNRQIITSEIIYYWMISLEIPMECQKWHLNRLLTLIRVCDEKNQPGRKKSRKDVIAENRALNQMRRARTGSRG